MQTHRPQMSLCETKVAGSVWDDSYQPDSCTAYAAQMCTAMSKHVCQFLIIVFAHNALMRQARCTTQSAHKEAHLIPLDRLSARAHFDVLILKPIGKLLALGASQLLLAVSVAQLASDRPFLLLRWWRRCCHCCAAAHFQSRVDEQVLAADSTALACECGHRCSQGSNAAGTRN